MKHLVALAPVLGAILRPAKAHLSLFSSKLMTDGQNTVNSTQENFKNGRVKVFVLIWSCLKWYKFPKI